MPNCEGCDTGNYLPHLISALTRDDRDRVVRPFLLNGSSAMVDKACRVAYSLLSGKNVPEVYGGVCNAYESLHRN